jgi:membrane carboxypeptidase/penicillin-binding protein
MFALLSKKDLQKAIKTEFESFCADKGYNPNVLMMVWNGYDDNKGLEVKDGTISKNIWVDTVENLEIDNEWYQKPDNVIGVPLNAITGEETEDSTKTAIFYYVNGSEYNNQNTEFVFKEKEKAN